MYKLSVIKHQEKQFKYHNKTFSYYVPQQSKPNQCLLCSILEMESQFYVSVSSIPAKMTTSN